MRKRFAIRKWRDRVEYTNMCRGVLGKYRCKDTWTIKKKVFRALRRNQSSGRNFFSRLDIYERKKREKLLKEAFHKIESRAS